MKAALISWFITLIIILVGRLVLAVWADLNQWRVWRRKCQDYWLKHYGTREEFINVFGKWW